jgi:integrase
MARIGKRVVDAAHPAQDGKRYIVWDRTLVGFGLLVLPTGVKSFIYDYRNVRGRKRRATIGRVGSLTPNQARGLAEEMALTIRTGGDPLALRTAARDALTVGDVLDRYLDSRRFAEKAESTRAIDRGRIKRHLRPLLNRRHVDDLRGEDIRRAMNAIREGKTAVDEKTGKRGRARVTGGPTTARDSIGLLRAILNWAIEEGMITNNPVRTVRLGSNGSRDTILEGPEDYGRLFKTLATMENEKRIRPAVADTIRVLALTGARRGEVTNLRWRFVDLKAGTITLPPTHHKSGHRTNKPKIIALPAAAQGIIARQPQGKPDEYVFKPVKGKGPLAVNKPWRDVRVEADLPEGIGLHGLRHSMASMLAMSGAQQAELQAALGHSTAAMAARYVHWADDARAALAERAAAPALAGMDVVAGKPAAQPVQLPGDNEEASDDAR